MLQPSRRQFIDSSSRWLLTGALGVAGSTVSRAQTVEKPTALDPDLVREIVGSAHGNFDRVRQLVEAHPALVNACWDWGGGDFETPLQAAAHTGRREIAEYLLSRGARIDLFAAAMLGQLSFVQAAFAMDPAVDRIHGPHGFTLHHCASRGGEEAGPVVAFLESIGASTEAKRALPLG